MKIKIVTNLLKAQRLQEVISDEILLSKTFKQKKSNTWEAVVDDDSI
jgi:hypothetical protein